MCLYVAVEISDDLDRATIKRAKSVELIDGDVSLNCSCESEIIVMGYSKERTTIYM